MNGVNTLREDSELQPKSAKGLKKSSDRSAELKVLDRFLGTWRSEYRLPKAEWTPEEKTGSADLVYTQELGGHVIRERAVHADQTTSTLLLIDDAEQRKYRSWWFNSPGLTTESSGRWDESTKTLSWTTIEPSDFKGTTQQRFSDTGKLDWTVLVQDEQGVAKFRMEGTSGRVSDPMP